MPKGAAAARVECQVCVSSCTPLQMAECGFCDFAACKVCVKRYLLSSSDDANCMSCKRLWSNEVLCAKLGKTFMAGEWKAHREDVLYDREVSMLAETQPYVTQELKRRENVVLLASMLKERQSLKRKLAEVDRTIHQVRSNVRPPVDAEERAEFVHQCGSEGCGGFLSTSWKCRKCEGWTCGECGAFKGQDPEGHVCREQDRASMDAIKRDSRRCVGCGIYVHKISGCNQMYCTVCHTAWDYRTGRKVNGTIHNPHYIEMQRHLQLLGRDVNDVPCGGIPSVGELKIAFRSDGDMYLQLGGFMRVVLHIQHVELHRYPDREDINDNRDLRVKLHLGEIERDEMKRTIQQREKKNLKNRDIHMILQMFITTSSDLLRQAVVNTREHRVPAAHTIMGDLKRLVGYTNAELAKIANRLSSHVPCIQTRNEETQAWYVNTTLWPRTYLQPLRPPQAA
jgi:hypothetical protein